MGDFDFNQRVSSQLAFLLVILLGFLAAWYSVSAGQKIVENAKDSETFNADKNVEISRELKSKR